ncbi:hypothetical protein M2T28_14515 [Elizabethkingia miricola]|jgi:hypothetical protein|uniref:hypothetical protein n=1 Tax=Elizabethkingia TaxID=308865 RepID=UPI00061CC950|nr:MULTISPECIES: hypothetical protein [Elizabethkingia]MCL1653833.1 hypothetical protein [Elizabethkingia miricola]QCO45809.1 hypothetical protein FCS00_05275 [Elizabethkingia sp. 2-6]WQM37651.1 hypothetical protein U2S95_14925 [Elizabethkingia miricola]CRH24908.1 Uncharacterised protein [Chlamydia trachomatis]
MNINGTKEIIIDESSIFKPTSGYVSVKLTNLEGWPVATVYGENFETLKANAVLFSKAPEMLEILSRVLDCQAQAHTLPSWLNEEIENLIKEATE